MAEPPPDDSAPVRLKDLEGIYMDGPSKRPEALSFETLIGKSVKQILRKIDSNIFQIPLSAYTTNVATAR